MGFVFHLKLNTDMFCVCHQYLSCKFYEKLTFVINILIMQTVGLLINIYLYYLKYLTSSTSAHKA